MALLRMAVENYRCFKERQEIELRPITVVLGKNNSGKSALTRLPLLLESGIRTDSNLPLDLDSLGDDPPDYLDLVYGRNVHRALRLEFVTDDEDAVPTEVKATIQNVDERRTQFVREFEINTGHHHAQLDWVVGDESGHDYMLTVDGHVPSVKLRPAFRGLIPLTLELPERLRAALTLLPQHLGNIRYLSSYRQRPSRLVRLPSRSQKEVGAAGENAAGMLVDDHVRGGHALLDELNRLLGDNLTGWRLEVEPQGPMYAISLCSLSNPDLTVNLLDSGTGVAQVLPLLVQLAYDRKEPSHTGVLHVIEEPELHLHPAFHALLADLFIAGMDGGRSRFLVETHSETMLLRLRRRIAEGRISSGDVAIYFVDHGEGSSRVRRIEVDGLGNLDYWPSGVFSEDFEETKKLAEAQFARERDES
ncbi:DUF3696 domain-containing protein [Actinomadura sp. ATCC 31491]|uniref:DUF3696 domain-containing protein n=1 Tax=Actinomadura luzonensis TaxID=2805427 RepID=A0ABT0FLB0_9ACTN|nr:DUF3696 domain-containing protein [Actinomadura luzonensis]MCK2213029.1 DUF3696 domain-containing protein [Actinomadura luzonensis]